MKAAELFPVEGSHLEIRLRRRQYFAVAGVDEVGRGCLAGPVVAAAVILNNYQAKFIDDIDDSKKVSRPERERLAKLIQKWAVAYSIAAVESEVIDQINILQASLKAMRLAVEALPVKADYVLVDGHMRVPGMELPQRAIIQGDGRCKSIGAASIVAKVYRDKLMTDMHVKYPQYKFHANKGYGTTEHWDALRKHGPCPLHRISFNGVSTADIAAFQQMALVED